MKQQTTLTTSKNTSYMTGRTVHQECHKGFIEVIKGIFVGKQIDIENVLNKVDILVPLNSVNGRIWEKGWRNEIIYVPIEDYGVLPKDVEDFFVEKLVNLYNEGKKMAIFCMGGHGRTGYFASLILGKLGISDPIACLRENYCKESVETNSQVIAISEFCDKPEFIEKYKLPEKSKWGFYNKSYDNYSISSYAGSTYTEPTYLYGNPVNKTCRNCIYYEGFANSSWGECILDNKYTTDYTQKCSDFEGEV